MGGEGGSWDGARIGDLGFLDAKRGKGGGPSFGGSERSVFSLSVSLLLGFLLSDSPLIPLSHDSTPT